MSNLSASSESQAVVNSVSTAILTGKKWYKSRTFWANVIAFGALISQTKFGFVVDPAYQGLGISLINLVLRKLTKEEIIW